MLIILAEYLVSLYKLIYLILCAFMFLGYALLDIYCNDGTASMKYLYLDRILHPKEFQRKDTVFSRNSSIRRMTNGYLDPVATHS